MPKPNTTDTPLTDHGDKDDESAASSNLPPALYLVPTPLGNRGDFTQRALSVLAQVTVIAAEDTRHSKPLIAPMNPQATWIAAHQHNENNAAERIVTLLERGVAVALISDAGTPGICDPGARVVNAVRAAALPIVPLPGACAAITALSASGLVDTPFYFAGFLPSKASQRRARLKQLNTQIQDAALVFYEAPHRITDTLNDCAACLPGKRDVLIARELTKCFESIVQLPLPDAVTWLLADKQRQKGEFVLVITPAAQNAEELIQDANEAGEQWLPMLLEEGLSTRQASQVAARLSGGKKKVLYEKALALKNNTDL